MAEADRLDLIKKIEKKRGTRVISYITTDRVGLDGYMADVDARVLELHVRALFDKGMKDIDLFLITYGGMATAARQISTLLREFLGKKGRYSVLVPAQAMSAGTELCLGADEIVMGPGAYLGPIDTQTGIGSTENLNGYFALADSMGLRSRRVRERLLVNLSKKISPILLGRTYRIKIEGERTAYQMLKERRNALPDRQNRKIVKYLVEQIGLHGTALRRGEARSAGISFVKYSEREGIDGLMSDLHDEYEAFMTLGVPFARDISRIDPEALFQFDDLNDQDVTGNLAMEAPVAVVESAARLDVARSVYGARFWRDAPGPADIVSAGQIGSRPSGEVLAGEVLGGNGTDVLAKPSGPSGDRIFWVNERKN